MSNPLSVRRVRIQTIDKNGNPEGEPSYGVMAFDSYQVVYTAFENLKYLNRAIKRSKSILRVADSDGVFSDADHSKIGRNNFYGEDWMLSVAERNFYCIICHQAPIDVNSGYDTCEKCAKRL